MSKFLAQSPVAVHAANTTHVPQGLSSFFTAQLQDAIQHCLPETGVGVIMIHVNNFEDLSAKYGADLSQQLSTDIAQRLLFRLRGSDILVHQMGEYRIIVKDLKASSALIQVKRKLLSALDSAFELAGHELWVHASAGYASYPEDAQDAYGLETQAYQTLAAV